MAIDILLMIFSAFGSFRGRHLSASHAVRNALLLVVSPLADFRVAVLLCGAVVFVVVDGAAQIVLLAVNLLLLALAA